MKGIDLVEAIKNQNQKVEDTKARAGGSLQSDWTGGGSLLPVSEWASGILGEGLYKSPYPGIIEKSGPILWRRANKKQYFFKSSASLARNKWGTGRTDIYGAAGASDYVTNLDSATTTIDPVEMRTYTPVAWETIEEVDMVPVEAYVRGQLADAVGFKTAQVLYCALDHWDKTQANFNYSGWEMSANASAFDRCNNNTVDWGDAFSTDNFKAGVEAIITDSYIPTDLILPPAMYIDLFNESQFINASQYGSQNSAIVNGVIPQFMGIDTYQDNYMPNDDAAKDWGLMVDRNKFEAIVISKDAKVDVDTRYSTGEVEFYLTVKMGAEIIQENASCVFYT